MNEKVPFTLYHITNADAYKLSTEQVENLRQAYLYLIIHYYDVLNNNNITEESMKKCQVDEKTINDLIFTKGIVSSIKNSSESFQYDSFYLTDSLIKISNYANYIGLFGEISSIKDALLKPIKELNILINNSSPEFIKSEVIVEQYENSVTFQPIILCFDEYDLSKLIAFEDGSEISEKKWNRICEYHKNEPCLSQVSFRCLKDESAKPRVLQINSDLSNLNELIKSELAR